jgi:hypothetical protein
MSRKFQRITVAAYVDAASTISPRFFGRLNDDCSHLFPNGMQCAQSGFFVLAVFRSVDLRFENRNVPEGRSYYHVLTVVNPKAVEIVVCPIFCTSEIVSVVQFDRASISIPSLELVFGWV